MYTLLRFEPGLQNVLLGAQLLQLPVGVQQGGVERRHQALHLPHHVAHRLKLMSLHAVIPKPILNGWIIKWAFSHRCEGVRNNSIFIIHAAIISDIVMDWAHMNAALPFGSQQRLVNVRNHLDKRLRFKYYHVKFDLPRLQRWLPLSEHPVLHRP